MERISLLCARKRTSGALLSLIVLFSGFLVSGCGSNGAAGGLTSSAISSSGDGLPRRELPPADEVATNTDYLKIAVKYVSYRSSDGSVVADESSVREMLDYASKVWAQCDIGFEITQYEVVNPADHGLIYNPGTYGEIDRARMQFQDDTHILMMGTGTWGRSSNLGSANCYSSFPGDAAEGVICEKSAAANPVLMAHEVGHWFYLKHVSTSSNLMDPIVGGSDDTLTDSQCELARRTVGESRRSSVL